MIARRMVLKSGMAGLGIAALPSRVLASSAIGLVLIDPALPLAGSWRARLEIRGAAVVMADRDLVRQWRDHLRDRLSAGEPGLALVQWDKALLLTGLAREDRLRVAQRRIGRSSFAVTITM